MRDFIFSTVHFVLDFVPICKIEWFNPYMYNHES